MGNLLFSPNGRISSSQFMLGAIVLIIYGAITQLAGLISFQLAIVLSLVGLVTIWCWVVLWVKRFHDGGKSGWMSLVVILVWIVIGWISSIMLMPFIAGDMAQQTAEMTEAMESAGEAGDLGGVWTMMMDMMGKTAKKTAIPNAIMGAVVAGLVAYVGNMLIKHDPNDNQWGPAGVGSTFE